MNKIIWILADNKIGSTKQAIALAEELKISYELKNVSYNMFAKLPNILLLIYPFHIKKNFLKRYLM